MIQLAVSSGLFVAYLGVMVAIGVRGIERHWFRGRHVSKPTLRRLGWRVAFPLRSYSPLVVGPMGGWFPLAWDVALGVLLLWALDDLLFSDDEKPRRKHEWARVRIRMPAPIKLRLAERWSPAPA